MANASILLVSLNPRLSNRYSQSLNAAHFVTTTGSTLPEAWNIFQHADFDLVLICPSVPFLQSEWLLRLIRASGSLTPVYTLESGSDAPDDLPLAAITQLLDRGSTVNGARALTLYKPGPLSTTCTSVQLANPPAAFAAST